MNCSGHTLKCYKLKWIAALLLFLVFLLRFGKSYVSNSWKLHKLKPDVAAAAALAAKAGNELDDNLVEIFVSILCCCCCCCFYLFICWRNPTNQFEKFQSEKYLMVCVFVVGYSTIWFEIVHLDNLMLFCKRIQFEWSASFTKF